MRRLCTNNAHRAALRAAAAIRARAAHLAFAAGALVAACSSVASAKPYGMGEDLLYRPGHPLEDLSWLVTWTFYALAVFVGGWALLRLKMHLDAPKPGGPIVPVVGIAFAVALATTPSLIEALLEGLAIGHEPPVWRGE